MFDFEIIDINGIGTVITGKIKEWKISSLVTRES
jgi:hypothetical protein